MKRTTFASIILAVLFAASLVVNVITIKHAQNARPTVITQTDTVTVIDTTQTHLFKCRILWVHNQHTDIYVEAADENAANIKFLECWEHIIMNTRNCQGYEIKQLDLFIR